MIKKEELIILIYENNWMVATLKKRLKFTKQILQIRKFQN